MNQSIDETDTGSCVEREAVNKQGDNNDPQIDNKLTTGASPMTVKARENLPAPPPPPPTSLSSTSTSTLRPANHTNGSHESIDGAAANESVKSTCDHEHANIDGKSDDKSELSKHNMSENNDDNDHDKTRRRQSSFVGIAQGETIEAGETFEMVNLATLDRNFTPNETMNKNEGKNLKNAHQESTIAEDAELGPELGIRLKLKSYHKLRLAIALLGLSGLVFSQVARTVINNTIVDMVEPPGNFGDQGPSATGAIYTKLDAPGQNDSWTVTNGGDQDHNNNNNLTDVSSYPRPEPTGAIIPGSRIEDNLIDDRREKSQDKSSDQIDPISDLLLNEQNGDNQNEPNQNNENEQNENGQSDGKSERFKWSNNEQGHVKGAFYYGYTPFMILGGRLAELYGAKYVIMLAVFGSAVVSLLTPFMAHYSFIGLIALRFALGFAQSGIFPAMYALFNCWLTMDETSLFAPLIKLALRLGSMAASKLPGLFLERSSSSSPDGLITDVVTSNWPMVFYFTGGMCAIWCIVWLVLATSRPQLSRLISRNELAHIEIDRYGKPITEFQKVKHQKVKVEKEEKKKESSQREVSKKSEKTPWLLIMSTPSVLALMLVKITCNFSLDFMTIEIPTYMRRVYGADSRQISAITTCTYSIQVVMCLPIAWMARTTIERRWLAKTNVRRLFQGVSNFGMALAYLALVFWVDRIEQVHYALIVLAFSAMFMSGGETMLPYDLSRQYPATIMGIANSFANLSAPIVTRFVALALGADGADNVERWNIVLISIAGALIFGGLVFIFVVSSISIDPPQPTTSDGEQQDRSIGHTNAESRVSLDPQASGCLSPPAIVDERSPLAIVTDAGASKHCVVAPSAPVAPSPVSNDKTEPPIDQEHPTDSITTSEHPKDQDNFQGDAQDEDTPVNEYFKADTITDTTTELKPEQQKDDSSVRVGVN